MALTNADLIKARNVRIAAGYPATVGLTQHVVDGPLWRCAFGQATNRPGEQPSVFTVSPVGEGATDSAAFADLLVKMIASTSATAAEEAAQSTAAANVASAVAAAAA